MSGITEDKHTAGVEYKESGENEAEGEAVADAKETGKPSADSEPRDEEHHVILKILRKVVDK